MILLNRGIVSSTPALWITHHLTLTQFTVCVLHIAMQIACALQKSSFLHESQFCRPLSLLFSEYVVHQCKVTTLLCHLHGAQ